MADTDWEGLAKLTPEQRAEVQRNFAPKTGTDTVGDDARRRYGYLAAFLDHPEVGPILRRAAEQGYDQAVLEGELYATNWWKQNGQAARNFEALQSSDPAEVQRRVGQRELDLRIAASRLGVTLSPDRLRQIATDAVRLQMTDAEVQAALGAELKYDPTSPQGGTVGETSQQLRRIAGDYLQDMSDATAFDYAQKIAKGETTIEAVRSLYAQQATGLLPYLTKFIGEGGTPRNYFDSARQQAARLLEVEPDSIDLRSAQFSPILGVPGDDGMPRAMTLAEQQNYVTGLDGYKRTKGALEKGANVVEEILTTFGKVAR